MQRLYVKAEPSTSKKVKSKEARLIRRRFLKSLQSNRENAADSVSAFTFNEKRVKILSQAQDVPPTAKGIAYWMARDQRVEDNWAFLFSQRLAIKNKVPLHVIFCLTDELLGATLRHLGFMLKGLERVSKDCQKLNINFHLLRGQHSLEIPKFVKNNSMGALISDFSPLRIHRDWVESVMKALPGDVPLVQVDAHNIVPIWIASEQQENVAYFFRKKINIKLEEFLTEFPPVIKHPHKASSSPDKIDWKAVLNTLKADESVGEVKWIQPGYWNAAGVLESFINQRLSIYATQRNNPTVNALSNLSPFFHFGQLAPQRAVLEVLKHKEKYEAGVEAFCKETIVRRELSDNFCFYNENYDNFNGLPNWAKTTLNAHREDKRPNLYTRKKLEEGKTHDMLWNAAQNQMRVEGKMHGLMRMYWAKKILEWTKSPEDALSEAIYLNDRYSLDGRDPNGYVGCLRSIGGVHDQGLPERAIFGKIRYMDYQGCKRKFDVKAFLALFGGK